jgi:cyclase
MIKKRIIPKLLLEVSQKSGKVITGTSVGYSSYRNVGSPISQAEIYQSTISDELMVVFRRDSQCSFQQRLETLSQISQKILMPLSFGGSLTDIDQVKRLFDVGIEKVILGRALQQNPMLITETANLFGSQAVVVSIDYSDNTKNIQEEKKTGVISAENLIQELKAATEAGAGEISLNDVGRDGMMSGTNIPMLAIARSQTSLPIIQSCGIGKTAHFVEAFENGADAVAVGSFFAFVNQNFIEIRSHIRNSGIDIRY